MIDQNELMAKLRSRIAVYGGASAFAKEAGISETLVSLVACGRQKPGPKIARALGYRKIIRFEPLQSNLDVE